ncbi:MAG: hypothetical protein Q8K70_00560 [Bacteroidota bacterium]|nr:hypothetical protein [Bacteroidota bacterium]
MKRFLLIALFCLISQLRAQSHLEKSFFRETLNDTFKKVSLLVVRHFEEISVTPFKKGDYQIETILRLQYHIKDMAALDNFKTLDKFADAKSYRVLQIKQNGTEKIIYEFENKNYDPESKFNDDEDSPKEDDQMPLENIEIGDIIDYRYVYVRKTTVPDYEAVLINNGMFFNRYQTHPNTNIYKSLVNRDKLLNPKNPILSYCIIVKVSNDLKFISKTLNCKEKFEIKSLNDSTYYEFKKSSIERTEAEDFSYAYLTLPNIKFAVVQTDPKLIPMYPHQFINEQISFQDITNLGLSFYENKNFIPKYLHYLNTRKQPEPYEQVSLSSFFKRFNKTFASGEKDKVAMLNLLHEYITNEDKLNQHQFGDMANMVILARYCDYIKLPYQMMACMPKFNGKWADALTPFDMRWGIYLPNNGNPIYISEYSKSGNIYQKFGYLSNTEIILFNKETKAYEVKIYPMVNYLENTTLNHSEVLLDSNFKATVKNKSIFKGYNKFLVDDYLENYFNSEGLYVNTPFYGLVDYNDIYNFKEFNDTSTFYPEYRRLSQSFSDLKLNYKRNDVYKYLYKEYGFYDLNLDSFNLINDGYFADNESDSLGYRNEFTTYSFYQTTNIPNQMVLALGRLITSQYEVSPYKVEKRITDINISHQRNYQWRIKVQIPNGYECLNKQHFNHKVENEAGTFESTLTEKDGYLYLNVNKIYNSHYLPKEKWMQMVEFLQQASFLYDQEIVIEKIAQ